MQTRQQVRQHALSVVSRLPRETIGLLASFLDAKSIGRFAVAVVPALDRPTREAYLHRNFRLLEQYGKSQPTLFRMFLEVNDDWTALYDDGGNSGNNNGDDEQPRPPSRRSLLSQADVSRFEQIFNNLTFLIEMGRVDIVRHLIEVRKVDVNARLEVPGMRFKPCPLYLTLLRGNADMIRYVMSVPTLEIGYILHDIIRSAEVPKRNLQLFLSHPLVDVNVVDPTGLTPLHYLSMIICDRKFLDERLGLMLSHKDINVNMVDGYGLTPLHRAVSSWHREAMNERTVKFLVDAGADLNHPRVSTRRSGRTTEGRSPLEAASEEQVAIINRWLGKKKSKVS